MPLYFTINSPHQWVETNAKGVGSSGVVDDLAALPTANKQCVAVVPGEQVVTRVESMPVKNRAKLLAAIPYSIEDSLIQSVDDLHFVLLHTAADNRVSFAYVSRSIMTGWLDQLEQVGIEVEAMLPDYLLLPSIKGRNVITRSVNGGVLLRSGLYSGAVTNVENLPVLMHSIAGDQVGSSTLVVDESLAEVMPESKNMTVSYETVGSKLSDWLEKSSQSSLSAQGSGLLSREYQQGNQVSLLRKYWPAVAMIVLAFFIKLGSDVGELFWLQQQNTELQQSTQQLYKELFPGSKLLPGKARVQTKNKLAGLQNQSAGNDYNFLLVTTASLLKDQNAVFEELDFKQGRLLTVLTLNDFSHLDRIKKRLQSNTSLDVVLKQSGARGSKVQARFEISRRAS